MGMLPSPPVFSNEVVGFAVAGGYYGTKCNSGASHTKGTWISMGTPAAEAIGIEVYIDGVPFGAGSSGYVDIGYGPDSSSVEVLCPDLLWSAGGNAGKTGGQSYFFPVRVPKRELWVRCQSSGASADPYVRVRLIYSAGLQGEYSGLARVTAYGLNAADSGGTEYDTGTTGDTKNGWTELVASTAHPIKILYPRVTNGANTSRSSSTVLYEIGVGASTNEIVVVPEWSFVMSSSIDQFSNHYGWGIAVDIPAGSRLAVRGQATLTGSDRLFDVVCYGVD